MKMRNLSLAAMVVGVLLILLSVVWPRVVGTERLWSDEQARAHSVAAAELHSMAHQQKHAAGRTDDDSAGGADELEAARQRYEQSEEELLAARTFRRRTVLLLKWAGVCCSIGGAVGYFLARKTTG